MEILRSSGSAAGNGGYIEVRPGGVNKGAFVSFVLSRQVQATTSLIFWCDGVFQNSDWRLVLEFGFRNGQSKVLRAIGSDVKTVIECFMS